MKNATLTLILLLMALSCPLFAYRPAGSPLQLDILVNGAIRPVYPHNGRLYLEALRGEEFTIRLRNNSSSRIAVALSVDGLNTIDAKRTAAAAASKWVIDPWEVVEVNGWQVSSQSSRSFYFTSEQNSYGAALGQTQNLGIISAAVFREVVYTPPPRVTKGEAYPPAEGGESRAKASKPQAAPAPGAPASEAKAAGGYQPRPADYDDYAATGMGRERDNQVTRVHLRLEPSACQQIDLRYEYRSELIRLGVIPRSYETPRYRRESASGFSGSYCPVVR